MFGDREGRLRGDLMKNNFEEVVGVEEALDRDAVAVVPVLDAAVVQLGLRLRRVLRVVRRNRCHGERTQWRATT